jgi:hypothetical protein
MDAVFLQRKGQCRAAVWRRLNLSYHCQPEGLIVAEIPEQSAERFARN